jgi:hypothetical protein
VFGGVAEGMHIVQSRFTSIRNRRPWKTPEHISAVLQLWTILLMMRHQQQLSKVVGQPDHEHRQVPIIFNQVCQSPCSLQTENYSFHFAIVNGDGGCGSIIRSVHQLC